MKIQPITHVTGIRIELTLEEALLVVQDRRRKERVVDDIRTMLRGSGVDPETGEPVPTVLGLKAAPVKALTMSDDPPESPKDEIPFDCPYCDKQLKTERGLNVHISRMHRSQGSSD